VERLEVDQEAVVDDVGMGARHDEIALERIDVFGRHGFRVARRDHALGDELLGVDASHTRMIADVLVHDRLRRGRFVRLTVTVLAVADEIDDDVLVEFHAEIERELSGQRDRFRIVPVDVEDRRLDDFRDVRAVQRRARIERVAGREADLVVDDDVHRATGRIATRLRQIERLHDHALAGERGVAMDQQR